MKINYIALIIFVVVSELAGVIGSIFTTPNIDSWYSTLVKSPLNPPSWVFGPVWTLLFALMGISAYLIWQKGWSNPNVRLALLVFFLQLVINISWSALFFGMHSPLAAFVGIIILWVAIVATIILFWRISPAAGWLLIPYILWVSFASYLNYTVWILNK